MKRLLFLCVLVFLLLESPKAHSADGLPASNPQDLPYQEFITTTINGLAYSGFPIIVKPEVSLSLDFDKQEWTLHNIHQYDEHGAVVLEQGRYGLCAELSTYVYEQLKPMLKQEHDLKFAMALEPGFFPTMESNHIVLLMMDKLSGNAFLIDPSFHRYGKLTDLNEYRILGIHDSLTFVKDRSPDFSYKVDKAIPLFIKNDLLLTFSVVSVDGKFDKDNFLFVISAYRRYQPSLEDIVIFGRVNSKVERLESRAILEKVLTRADVKVLFNKLNEWATRS